MNNKVLDLDMIVSEIKNNLRRTCNQPWEAAVAPFCVAPKVYFVGGNDWVACYLIDTGEGLILLDAAMQEFLYLVTESIRMLGYDLRDVEKILISHAHLDHCGGARALAEHTGAEIYLSHEDWDLMQTHRELVFHKYYAVGEFVPAKFYNDACPVVLGNISIDTLHTPGHTPGTTSFFFTVADDEGNRYRCAMHGGLGVNSLSDQYLAKFNLPRTLQRSYCESLRKLRDSEVDITLPSHPDTVERFFELADRETGDFRLFVNKAVWPKLMDDHLSMMEQLLGRSV